MKKLLSLLATVSLVSTSTASTVACGNENNDPIDEKEGIEQDILTILASSLERRINSLIQLQDGTILVAGGFDAATSFLASVNLSNTTNPQVQILAQGSTVFPSVPRSIIQLQDGTILAAGGFDAATSFLASVNLSDPANPQIQILAQGPDVFPGVINSITQLQDDTILVIGGSNEWDWDDEGNWISNSFAATIDLSNTINPVQILAQGPDAFPGWIDSITELQDGTILVVGGSNEWDWDDEGNWISNSFVATINPTNSNNPVQILAQGPDLFPGQVNSVIQLQDGTILVGEEQGWSFPFLATIDLSNTINPVQILAQGPDAFPGWIDSIIELQDGTILVVGEEQGRWGRTFSFLATIDLSNTINPVQILAQDLEDPGRINSIFELEDGTIFVVGEEQEWSYPFLATIDLSNTINPVQILAQGPDAFPGVINSITELQDGTFLVVGEELGRWGQTFSFLATIDLFRSR